MTAKPELARLRAAYFALCAHLHEAHGVSAAGTASQVHAQHQAAHAVEGTPWHPTAADCTPDTDEATA